MARPRHFRDPDVLTRAMLVFWQNGFAGTQIRQLEQATGLKASSLYNRFESKQALYEEVLEHYLEKVVQWRIDRYLTDPNPLHGLRRFLETCYDYIDVEGKRPPMACLLANTALEIGVEQPRLAARVNEGLSRVETAFAQCLTRARQLHLVPADARPALLARQLLLGLQGILVMSRVNPDRQALQSSTEALLAAIPISSQPADKEPA